MHFIYREVFFFYRRNRFCERNIARYPHKAQKENMNLNKELNDLIYILIQKRQYYLWKAEDILPALILQSTELLGVVFILNLYLVQLRNILNFDKQLILIIVLFTQTNGYTRRNEYLDINLSLYRGSSEVTKNQWSTLCYNDVSVY